MVSEGAVFAHKAELVLHRCVYEWGEENREQHGRRTIILTRRGRGQFWCTVGHSRFAATARAADSARAAETSDSDSLRIWIPCARRHGFDRVRAGSILSPGHAWRGNWLLLFLPSERRGRTGRRALRATAVRANTNDRERCV